ncbi:hypothetical protein BpHYR1_028980 [Brachionus plicatilis]|uniref:Uncharacterized protein n=1 Tax=Brachionus plicatilis TaxID=10195 RepID=A0A3M7RNS3_BRAPC|nr:hypothetical protein BpHYR1_028980 [Brachionus plicatilis]
MDCLNISGFYVTHLSFIPKKMILLQNSICDISNFMIPGQTQISLSFLHIKGLDVDFNFFQIEFLNDNSIEFLFSKLVLYQNSSQVKSCSNFLSSSPFRGIKILWFRPTVEYFPNTCPLIFNEKNLVNKNLFKNTKNIRIEGILDKIEKNSFTQLHNLESLEIFIYFLKTWNELIFNLVRKDLTMKTFVDSKNVEIYLRKIDCSCTVLWLISFNMAAQCDKFKYESDIQMEKSITDFVYTTEFITLCIFGLITNGLSMLALIKNNKQNKLTKKSSVYLYMVEFVGNSIKTASNILNVLIAKNRFDLLRGEQNLPKSTDKLKNFFQSIEIFLVVILVNVESILTIEINNLIESFELDYADFPIKNTFKNIFKNSFNIPVIGSLIDGGHREILYFCLFIFNDFLLYILIVVFDCLLLSKLKQAISHKKKICHGLKKKISEKENFENRITYSVLFNCSILMVLRSFEFGVSLYILLTDEACDNKLKICSNISQLGNSFYLISCSLNLIFSLILKPDYTKLLLPKFNLKTICEKIQKFVQETFIMGAYSENSATRLFYLSTSVKIQFFKTNNFNEISYFLKSIVYMQVSIEY